MPKTTHIQHFSGELKFTAIECIIQEGSIIFIYTEPTQKLVEPEKKEEQYPNIVPLHQFIRRGLVVLL